MILEVNDGKEFVRTIPKEGLEPAILYSIIDLGSQDSKEYGMKRKLELTFELPNQKHVFAEENGEQCLVVSKRFTMSLHPKSGLFKVVKSITGAEPTGSFDIMSLLGSRCLLNLVHKVVGDDTYCNIDALIKGTNDAVCENAFVQFDLSDFDQLVFDKLPEWKQKVIAGSPEYQEVIKTQ